MFVFDQLKKGDPQIRLMAGLIVSGMALLLAGLWYVQVVSANRYRADLEEQSIRVVRVPAIRGKVLDRNGVALAANRPSYNVNLYLEELRRYFRFEYTNKVLREYKEMYPGTKLARKTDEALQRAARYRVVSNLLFQVSSLVREPQILEEKRFTNHYNNLRSLPFPLIMDLSDQQMALFVERSARLPSLDLEVQPVRVYPWTNATAHLVGYLQRETSPVDDEDFSFQFRLPDYAGIMGVELAFDQQLRGHPGVKSVLVNNLQYRQAEEIITPPEPGLNVVLTLDLPLQRETERALRNSKPRVKGAAVVMDCRSGDVLALVSLPSYDPNQFISGISTEDWSKLLDEETRPLFNRATYGTYPPGSIFKIVVALAGLESGMLNTNDIVQGKTHFQFNGRGHAWKCTAPPDEYDFYKAFYLSCNCYFIDRGVHIGYERIVEMGRRFGLGKRTGITTHQEADGYFPDPTDRIKKDGSRWMAGDTANLCIGQGELLVTPLQIAVLTAAIANGGKVLEPRLVDRFEPPDPSLGGETIRFPSGQKRGELRVKPEHLQTLRNAMLLDVEHRDPARGRHGTGWRAALPDLRICGKTGTAQLMEGRKVKEQIVWFASFAPYESPRYSVVVVVEDGESGASTCAPIAREIYGAILKRERRIPAGGSGALASN